MLVLLTCVFINLSLQSFRSLTLVIAHKEQAQNLEGEDGIVLLVAWGNVQDGLLINYPQVGKGERLFEMNSKMRKLIFLKSLKL